MRQMKSSGNLQTLQTQSVSYSTTRNWPLSSMTVSGKAEINLLVSSDLPWNLKPPQPFESA